MHDQSVLDDMPDMPNLTVGEAVWDDLMGCPAVIVRTERDEHGNLGVWLNTSWLGGGRFPWEVSVWYRDSE